jgi:uncharacterized membrane protein (DUF373 family)
VSGNGRNFDRISAASRRSARRLERGVVICLLALMGLVIVLSLFELGWIIVRDILTPPILFLGLDEVFEIFGAFLLVLIGLELLATLKAYFQEKVMHVEIILEAAMVAVARKIVVLDLEKNDGIDMLALAALLIAVAIAFRLLPRAHTAGTGTAEAEAEVPE